MNNTFQFDISHLRTVWCKSPHIGDLVSYSEYIVVLLFQYQSKPTLSTVNQCIMVFCFECVWIASIEDEEFLQH